MFFFLHPACAEGISHSCHLSLFISILLSIYLSPRFDIFSIFQSIYLYIYIYIYIYIYMCLSFTPSLFLFLNLVLSFSFSLSHSLSLSLYLVLFLFRSPSLVIVILVCKQDLYDVSVQLVIHYVRVTHQIHKYYLYKKILYLLRRSEIPKTGALI